MCPYEKQYNAPEYRKIGDFTNWIVFRGILAELGKSPVSIVVASICLSTSDTLYLVWWNYLPYMYKEKDSSITETVSFIWCKNLLQAVSFVLWINSFARKECLDTFVF